jgi:hypothetical protein
MRHLPAVADFSATRREPAGSRSPQAQHNAYPRPQNFHILLRREKGVCGAQNDRENLRDLQLMLQARLYSRTEQIDR